MAALKLFALPLAALLLIGYVVQIVMSVITLVLFANTNCGSGRRGSRSQVTYIFQLSYVMIIVGGK